LGKIKNKKGRGRTWDEGNCSKPGGRKALGTKHWKKGKRKKGLTLRKKAIIIKGMGVLHGRSISEHSNRGTRKKKKA